MSTMAGAAEAAASLAKVVAREPLAAQVKATQYKDINLLAQIIRYDYIMNCSNGTPEAWKLLERLMSNAWLVSRDTLKANPQSYISITLDQARMYL